MTACITCQHWQPRATPSGTARHGFAQCLKKPIGHAMSADAPACSNHKPVDDETAAKRAEWIKGVWR